MYSGRSAIPQLLKPPLRPNGQRGRDKKFNGCIRADHGSDVAPIENGTATAGRIAGELPLEVQQRRSHRRLCRNLRRRSRRFVAAQVRLLQIFSAQRMGYRGDGLGVGRIMAGPHRLDPDRPVKKPRIQVGIAEMFGETPRQRALAGGRGSIDGDDDRRGKNSLLRRVSSHRQPRRMSAPSRFIRVTKPGKLVPIAAASSIATGSALAQPSTRNAIAMR